MGFWFIGLIKLLNKNSVQKALKIQPFPHFGHCGTRVKILNKLIVVKLLQPKTLDVRLWFVRVLQLLIKNSVGKSLKVLPFPHFGHCRTRLKNLNELNVVELLQTKNLTVRFWFEAYYSCSLKFQFKNPQKGYVSNFWALWNSFEKL